MNFTSDCFLEIVNLLATSGLNDKNYELAYLTLRILAAIIGVLGDLVERDSDCSCASADFRFCNDLVEIVRKCYGMERNNWPFVRNILVASDDHNDFEVFGPEDLLDNAEFITVIDFEQPASDLESQEDVGLG